MFPVGRGLYQHPAHNTFYCSACGKEFSAVHHLNSHQSRSCRHTKRNLSELLLETKSFWESRKRIRLADDSNLNDPEAQARALPQTTPTSANYVIVSVAASAIQSDKISQSSWQQTSEPVRQSPSAHEPPESTEVSVSQFGVSNGHLSMTDFLVQDLDVPVAVRKATRDRRLPQRYREDTLPERLGAVQAQPESPIGRNHQPHITDLERILTTKVIQPIFSALVKVLRWSSMLRRGIVLAYRDS